MQLQHVISLSPGFFLTHVSEGDGSKGDGFALIINSDYFSLSFKVFSTSHRFNTVSDRYAIPTRPRPYPLRVERVLRPVGPPSRAASGRPPPQAPRTTTAILPWPHSPANQPPHPQEEEGDFIPVPRAPWQPVIRQSRYFPRWG